MQLPPNFITAQQALSITKKSEGYKARIMSEIMDDINTAAGRGLSGIHFINYDSVLYTQAMSECFEELQKHGYKMDVINQTISW